MPKRKKQHPKIYLPKYTGWGIKLILRLSMLETFILTYVLNTGKNKEGPKKLTKTNTLHVFISAQRELYSSCLF